MPNLSIDEHRTSFKNSFENFFLQNKNKKIRMKKLNAQKSIYKIREYEQIKKN